MRRNVILCGASGLVGGLCLPKLLNAESVGSVLVPFRQPLEIEHPKLRPLAMDFSRLEDYPGEFKGDALILTLGARMGSDASYNQVDFHLTAALAELGRRGGVRHCILISSPFAASWSPSAYLRAKGRAEDALARLDFELLDIVRPGPLTGRYPARWQETLGAPVLRVLHWMLGEWDSPLGAIHADHVASAVLKLIQDPHRFGTHTYQGRELNTLGVS